MKVPFPPAVHLESIHGGDPEIRVRQTEDVNLRQSTIHPAEFADDGMRSTQKTTQWFAKMLPGLAVQGVAWRQSGFPGASRNSNTDSGNSIQRATSACPAARESMVIAVCRSASRPSSRIGIAVIRPNITRSFPGTKPKAFFNSHTREIRAPLLGNNPPWQDCGWRRRFVKWGLR